MQRDGCLSLRNNSNRRTQLIHLWHTYTHIHVYIYTYYSKRNVTDASVYATILTERTQRLRIQFLGAVRARNHGCFVLQWCWWHAHEWGVCVRERERVMGRGGERVCTRNDGECALEMTLLWWCWWYAYDTGVCMCVCV